MIRYFIKGLAMTLALVGLPACEDSADTGHTSYFISSEGDDRNSGKTEGQAWKSIEKINQTDFSPGDEILLRGGDIFTGTIELSAEDGGTPEKRVRLASYGEGRAIVNGLNREGIIADSCNHLTIELLEVTGSGRSSGNVADGVLVRQCDAVILDQLDVQGFQHSGVRLHQCNDARITHVYSHENGFAGIHVTGTTMGDPVNYDNHNLYIGYCVAENNPGDPTVLENHSGNGILASSVKNGIIEYCEAFNNGWDMVWTGNGPVGIWIWDCTGFTIQYCIAHHNRTNPVAADGGGFDFDGGVSNSTIQYCISHHNEGAGFGLYEFGAAKPWENNTVRYNISMNDGKINGGSVGIWKNDLRGIMRNCQIYNNTFYNSQQEGSNIWLYDNYPGYRFFNNIFVHQGALISGGKSIRDETFLGNLYWNLSGDVSFLGHKDLQAWASATGKEMLDDVFVGIYNEPQLARAGVMEVTDPQLIDQDHLSGYLPMDGSPLIEGGLNLRELFQLDPGARDILGTPIPAGEKFDIGAVEYNNY